MSFILKIYCDCSGDLASEKNGTNICTLSMEAAFEIRN